MSIFNKIFKRKEEDGKNPESRNSKLPCLPSGREIRQEIGSDSVAGESNIDKADAKEEKMHGSYSKAGKAPINYRVLAKPLITEKTANLDREGKYVFEVANGVNKIEVKKELEAVYGVTATNVNIIKMKGKKTGAMRRIFGKRKDWKKAVVTLKKGESIEIYSGKEIR